MASITKEIPGGFSGKSGTAAGTGRCGQDLIRSMPKCRCRATETMTTVLQTINMIRLAWQDHSAQGHASVTDKAHPRATVKPQARLKSLNRLRPGRA